MPSLTFILPHWLYWAALALFPAAAMFLVHRQKQRGVKPGVSLFLAYLFWLCSGFVGMHRFYLRSAWGFLFIPFFALILWGSGHIRDAREDVSSARSAYESAQHHLEQAKKAVAENAAGAADKLTKAQSEIAAAEPAFADAQSELDHWHSLTRAFALALAALLLIDAALLPSAVRRVAAREAASGAPPSSVVEAPPVAEAGTGEDPTMKLHSPLTDAIEAISRRVGEYVAYWGILAVFAYYYEVVARYVFNSPTNWVHESMFLMFGMQYMLAGAYAYREDAHVRVDVIYAKFSARGKAIADIVTSVFFFIFTVTMLWTGARFALDAIEVGEHSFTEWGVQYWPVKLSIPVGAALIVLQGLARLIKDVLLLTRREA
jgi:TRAP-type mannitol/chloroaromatic compound transport system permease small subunit